MSTTKDASLAILLEEMDRNEVHTAVLVAVEGIVSNAAVAKARKEHPNRFLTYCCANPLTMTADAFRKVYVEGGFVGIKFHLRLHHVPLDERTRSFFRALADLQPVLLVDAWFSDADSDADVRALSDFVRQLPGLRIILAHAGGFRFQDVLPLVQHKHIFVDLSYVLNTFKKHKKELLISAFMRQLADVPVDKILFGSDFPEYSITETKGLLFALLDEYRLTNLRKQIVEENYVRLMSHDL